MLDLDSISDDARRLIVLYVVDKKNVRPGELGVSTYYVNKVRRGVVKVGAGLLCSALRYVTYDELRQLLKGWIPEANATPSDVLRVIGRMKRDAAFRDLVFNMFRQAFGEYLKESSREWIVTEADIEAFIKAKRLKGNSEETIRIEVGYIRRALAEMNWVLSPESIQEYLASLADEPYVLKHTTYSLKSFLKTVLKPKDPELFMSLYSAFTVHRPKNRIKVKLPTIDELKQILQRIESIEAKAYFIILAETGLRPGEPFLVTMDDVDFEHGMMRIGKITETKRAFVAFLQPKTIEWLKSRYLPRRESFIGMVVNGIKASGWFSDDVIERFKARLLPFDQGRLRREIKDAAKQVLGRDFELYELRKFFATWMISRGVPESIVNTLQGRAPPAEYRVLIEHYWSPRHEELRKWYLEHAPCLLC